MIWLIIMHLLNCIVLQRNWFGSMHFSAQLLPRVFHLTEGVHDCVVQAVQSLRPSRMCDAVRWPTDSVLGLLDGERLRRGGARYVSARLGFGFGYFWDNYSGSGIFLNTRNSGILCTVNLAFLALLKIICCLVLIFRSDGWLILLSFVVFSVCC